MAGWWKRRALKLKTTSERPRHIRWLRWFFFGKLLPSRSNLGDVWSAALLVSSPAD